MRPAPHISIRRWTHSSPVPAYLIGFLLIGIALSLAGPALSHLRDRVHTSDGGIAWVFVGQAAGYIAGSVFAGHGLDGGRGHRRWVAAMVLSTASLALIALAPTLLLLVSAFVVLGLACGLCDVSGNTLVMWSRPEGPGQLLNTLHLCFALGAMVTPLLVDRSLYAFDSVWGVALPMAALTAVCASLMLPYPSPARTRLATVERSHVGGARMMHVSVICAFFFAYVALETGFANWIHTYVEQIGYGDAGTATGVTSMFGVGFAVGRAAAIWTARHVTSGWTVALTTGMSLAASVLFVVFNGPGVMLWLVTLFFGVSVAPQYASMLAFAESHLALSGRNTSAIVAASGIGGLLMPFVVGQLFDRVGPQALPPTVLTLAVLTAAVAAYGGRILLRAQRPPVTSMNAPVT
ncbi:MAG TPA: MFS transporter [Ilumatobacteraceae bacterium]|nr:MFS transporter [Ilumatobacteraceae bacterium]